MMLSLDNRRQRVPLASLQNIAYIISRAAQTGHGLFSTVTQ
jgi:hypothetical protein